MKWYHIFILAVLMSALIIYLVIQNIINSIEYDYDFDEIDTSGIDVFNLGDSYIDIDVKLLIKNSSIFTVKIKSIDYAKIFFQKELFAELTSDLKDIIVKRKSTSIINTSFRIYITKNNFHALELYASKRDIIIDYDTALKMGMFNLHYKNEYIYKDYV